MKTFWTMRVLSFAAAMASCVFAIPSMARAASWSVPNSEHTLDSSDVGFTSTTDQGIVLSSQCNNSSLTATVTSSTNLEITAASFGGDCTANLNGAATCTVDSAARALPWTATPTTATNVTLDGLHIGLTFTQSTPGPGNCPAGLIGQNVTVTGRVTSGATFNSASHHLTLSNAEGLVSHSILGNGTPVTARGTFRDTQQTLIVRSALWMPQR
jgi:hypothetical protein